MKLKIILAVAAMAIGGAAYAQDPPAPSPEMMAARKAMMESCAADMKTLCDGKTGREGMMCMRENAEKVSPGCKDAMAKMMAARKPQ